MWLSRKNSINPTPTSPRRSNFNRHSFKNIDDLIPDDDKTAATTTAGDQPKARQKPSSPVSSPPATAGDHPKPKHKPSSPVSSPPACATAKPRHSVFHRVCLANQFTRAIASPRSKPVKPKPNKSHDSNAPAVKIHDKPNKTPDNIVPVDKIHDKPNKMQDSAAPAANIIHDKPNKMQDNIAPSAVNIPNAEKRVVVYMTSLGAVRPTFDACRAVRSILQGFLVPVDERDLSMDSSFKDELQTIMSNKNKSLVLPRVFIGGRYVGDADDMRQLSETGELKKLVEGLPAVSRGVCPGCGDFRFVICSDCNGSRKCYREKGGFRSCTLCNKNGLIRCPSCWTVKS